jgi:hypothetical protein
MAETLEVKPLGRTIVVSTFASELFDITTLSFLQRSERTNQMEERADAVDYWHSGGHHDHGEQSGLSGKTVWRFVLEIILAD